MTKQEVKAEVSMEDMELFNEQFEKDLENAEKEYFRGEQNLKEHEFVLKMMKEQLEAYKGAKDIIINYCKPLKPIYEYETKEEYLNFLKVAKKLEVEQEVFKLEQQSIPGMEKTISAKIEGLATLSAKIEKMRGDSE